MSGTSGVGLDSSVPSGPPTETRVLYRAGAMYDGLGHEVVRPASVLVHGEVIEAVYRGSGDPAIPSGTRIVDLGSGATLLPGMIDAHVHLVCTGGRAAIAESADQPDDLLERRAAINAETALAAGVTTVRDAGGKHYTTLRVRDELAQRSRLRILASGMPITVRGGHLHFYGMEANTKAEVIEAVAELADHGVDFIKVMASAGIQTPGNNPYSAQYSTETLQALVNAAHKRGLRVAAHAHSVEAIQSSISAGVDTLEHFSWLGPPEDDGKLIGIARDVASAGIFVDPTTIGLDASISPDGGYEESQKVVVRRIIERRQWCLSTLAEHGVEIIGGTDAGSTQVAFSDTARGLRVLSDLLGWSTSTAIGAITGASARALGLESSIGALVPKMRADLIVTDGDPAEDLAVLSKPTLVIKDGLPVAPSGAVAPGQMLASRGEPV